jgi:hypothetical protein
VIIRDTQVTNVYETLIRKHPTHPKPITSFWLTHDRNRNYWTAEESQNHMVNQTMLYLREHIKPKRPHDNPLKVWTNACWVYSWKRLNRTEAMNTWLVFIRYNPDSFSIRNPSQFTWHRVPETLDDRLPWTMQKAAPLSHWELVLGERSYFLGPNPPTSLPNDNHVVPWKVEEEPQNVERTAESSQTASQNPRPGHTPTLPVFEPPAKVGDDTNSPETLDDE